MLHFVRDNSQILERFDSLLDDDDREVDELEDSVEVLELLVETVEDVEELDFAEIC